MVSNPISQVHVVFHVAPLVIGGIISQRITYRRDLRPGKTNLLSKYSAKRDSLTPK